MPLLWRRLMLDPRNLQNGFGIQYGLIIKSFGFSTVQTTALNIPAGAAQIIGVTLSTIILRRFPVCYSNYRMRFFFVTE